MPPPPCRNHKGQQDRRLPYLYYQIRLSSFSDRLCSSEVLRRLWDHPINPVVEINSLFHLSVQAWHQCQRYLLNASRRPDKSLICSLVIIYSPIISANLIFNLRLCRVNLLRGIFIPLFSFNITGISHEIILFLKPYF
jgi:hypothetical protein